MRSDWEIVTNLRCPLIRHYTALSNKFIDKTLHRIMEFVY